VASAPLESAWLKLERATTHVNQLRCEITAAGNGDSHSLPLVRQYEPDLEAVVYRVREGFQVLAHWPFLVSEAIHHMRSALDSAWWQCAIKFLGREPTEDEARHVSFPVRKPGKYWDAQGYRGWVGPVFETIASRYQPPKTWAHSGFYALGSLDRLWNLDKHRNIPVLVVVVGSGEFRVPRPDEYVDCVPNYRETASGERSPGPLSIPSPQNPQPGEEVARMFVRKTGANPDVDIQAKITVNVVTAANWDLMDALDRFGATVLQILGEIEPLL